MDIYSSGSKPGAIIIDIEAVGKDSPKLYRMEV